MNNVKEILVPIVVLIVMAVIIGVLTAKLGYMGFAAGVVIFLLNAINTNLRDLVKSIESRS